MPLSPARRKLQRSDRLREFDDVRSQFDGLLGDTVDAELRDGILHVCLPRSTRSKARRIQING